MSDILRIGLVQYSPIWENPTGSIEKINSLLGNEKNDYQVLIFPEMSLTGFTFKSKYFAEDIDGISTQFFIKLAQNKKIDIFAGLIENEDERYYNTLVHFDSAGLIKARYRKIHPFSFAGEEKFYSSSKDPIITKIGSHKIGLSVCYDLRFPELYRFYAKEKVEAIINIANWPVKRITHWEALIKARAIENLCYFIGVNRVGSDPDNIYDGRSSIVSPIGESINLVSKNEQIIIENIDFNLVSETREKLKFLEDIKLI
ncbi:MAG: nitrilase-related carbon-nitrogen hydrolase [bacterium]